ncbi:hypothetical protein JCM10207_008408 [Rhodosporidiobolus poonsookiae]
MQHSTTAPPAPPATSTASTPLLPSSPPVDSRTRRIVVAAFWAVVLLGVPLWWKTTTLERRALPAARVQDWASNWQERVSDEGSETDGRVVKFSPHYKAVFSLLNQDSSSGSAILSWEVNKLINTHIRPFLSSLAPLHNFTLESQVQYFAPLAIEQHENEDGEGTYVVEDDLRAFINSAEWNLATGTTLDPVLHFILYVPSVQTRPLRVRSADGKDVTPAFITPQRGGVVILNPPPSLPEIPPSVSLDLPLSTFDAPFALFEQQLRTLLGAPSLPLVSRTRGPLAEAQVDVLIKRRLREAVKDAVESLTATVKMTGDNPNMRISKEVQARVRLALDELDKASASAFFFPAEALAHASRAQQLASQAYFDPSMLALLYFPDEHKYAVYTPLFGPVAVPLLVAALKEIKEWRKGKKEKREREKAQVEGAAEGRAKTD